MKRAIRRIGILILAGLTALAIAKMWGPFLMSAYMPQIRSLQDDINEDNRPSQNIARHFMNLEVKSIKKGDIVRIIFADGSVYDFEASRQCSGQLSLSCQWSGWTKKSSATQKASRSRWDREQERMLARDTCKQQDYSFTFRTGYWETSWPSSGSTGTVITNGRWVDTGAETVSTKGAMHCR